MARITKREKEALRLFKRGLRREFPGEVRSLVLFGSKARGDASKYSDVDVLVVLRRGGWRVRQKVYGVATDVLLEKGVDLSPKVFGRTEYKKLRSWGEPLLLNIEREGIRL